VRFVRSAVSTAWARREQAFSVDGGEAWVPNRVMEFTRTAAS
jgi:hypothetical protein